MTILDRRTANRERRRKEAHQMTIEESKRRMERKDFVVDASIGSGDDASTGTDEVWD